MSCSLVWLFITKKCPIVERLCVSLMRKGRNSGKKLMAARIVKHTLEIIHLLTDQNPVQVRKLGVHPLVQESGHGTSHVSLNLYETSSPISLGHQG